MKYSVVRHQAFVNDPTDEYTHREVWKCDRKVALANAKKLAMQAHSTWDGEKSPLKDRFENNGLVGYGFTGQMTIDDKKIDVNSWWTIHPEPDCY